MISDRGDSPAVNNLRNTILDKCPNVKLEPVSFFYDIDVFNKCADEGNILIFLDYWSNIHPLLVSIPLKEDFEVSYGVVYSKTPSKETKRFIKIIENEIKK